MYSQRKYFFPFQIGLYLFRFKLRLFFYHVILTFPNISYRTFAIRSFKIQMLNIIPLLPDIFVELLVYSTGFCITQYKNPKKKEKKNNFFFVYKKRMVRQKVNERMNFLLVFLYNKKVQNCLKVLVCVRGREKFYIVHTDTFYILRL